MARSRRDILAEQLARLGVLRALERRPGRHVLVVLSYHRIGGLEGNLVADNLFSASAEGFRDQVRYLRDQFAMPRLDEVITAVENRGGFDRPAALITFDDGYRDQFKIALPILQAAGARASFFIPTGFLERRHLPWWDRIAYILKKTPVKSLTLDYPRPLDLDLQVRPRSRVIDQVQGFYRGAGQVDEGVFFQQFEERAEVAVDPDALARGLFMSWDEVRGLVDADMEIGSHTHSHPLLSALTEPEQTEQLRVSKRILEWELGREITSIAYPYGSRDALTDRTKDLARDAGYRLGFSLHGGVNWRGSIDALDVQRIVIPHDLQFPLFRVRATFFARFGKSF